MWFEQLTGFADDSPASVREHFVVEEEILTSQANGRKMRCGRLEMPTLAELRTRVGQAPKGAGELRLSEVIANVQQLHADPTNDQALFQVASQFNLLEMASPAITPEEGIDRYEHDLTQGPACAIACGAGTIYRNYFVKLPGQVGQSAGQQIDCLADLGEALGNRDERLWRMQNGYAFPREKGLRIVGSQIQQADEPQRDRLRGLIRVGVQWNTEVTLASQPLSVSQVYASALPISYSNLPGDDWEPFARLVLEAAYEATLAAAVLNRAETGCDKVFLTMLGGGAFGNPVHWIVESLQFALERFTDVSLRVTVVSFGRSNRSVQELVERWGA